MNTKQAPNRTYFKPLSDKEHRVVHEVAAAAVNCATSIIYDQRHVSAEHSLKPNEKANIKADLQDLVCDSMAGVALEF